jgi:UDP-glucose 4-epimerase
MLKSAALVTGGAGFIGAALVAALRADGHPVTVIDRIPFREATRLAAFADDDGFAYRRATLDHAARLREHVAGNCVVYHLAANTENRADRADAGADVMDTVRGTAVLLDALAAQAAGTPPVTIVLTSSQLVYVPSADERVTELDGTVEPTTPFAAGKVAAEAFLRAHCRQHGHRGAVCRLANIVGPGMRRGIVHDLAKRTRESPAELTLLGDGEQTRSYLHVDDCVEALRTAARSQRELAVYNVANVDRISARAVAEIVVDEAGGGPVPIACAGGAAGWRGDVPSLRPWPQALLREGWRPARSSADAVRIAARALLDGDRRAPAARRRPELAPARRWRVLSERTLYESPWVSLALARVAPPTREPYEHHVVRLPSAVGVVLHKPERGVLLLHRHRFITDTTGFEIPAGGIDAGEAVEAAAARETLEETGWIVSDVEHLVSCNVSDGVTDQRFHLVAAAACDHAGPPIDAYEATSQVWVDVAELPELLRRGLVPGALSTVALLHALHFGRL